VGHHVPSEYLDQPRRFFLEWIPQLLTMHRDGHRHFGRVSSVAQFHLTGETGGWWHIVMGNDQVVVVEGQHPQPGFTLTMEVALWRRLNRGEVNGFAAWVRGDLQISGSKRQFLRVARLFR